MNNNIKEFIKGLLFGSIIAFIVSAVIRLFLYVDGLLHPLIMFLFLLGGLILFKIFFRFVFPDYEPTSMFGEVFLGDSRKTKERYKNLIKGSRRDDE